MTESFDRDPAALDEIEDLLAAYADARLSPSGPVLARMRAQAIRDASLQRPAAAAADQRRVSEKVEPPRWALPWMRLPRRAFALGLAATLMLGTSAAVLAAAPGSPLYGARVAIEGAFLPAQVDERLASHELHLDERLAEAQAAAARGDLGGLAAALAAYRAEVDAAVADIGDEAARLAHLEAELARHTALLRAIAATLPAEPTLDYAIDASQKATTRLKDKGAAKPAVAPDGGKPTAVPEVPNPPQGR